MGLVDRLRGARRPDPDDVRRGARTLVQGVWAAVLVAAGAVGFDVPAAWQPAVIAAGTPLAAGLIAWAANELEDADRKLWRRVGRALTVWARDPAAAVERVRDAAGELIDPDGDA